jgi:hypothetical protein
VKPVLILFLPADSASKNEPPQVVDYVGVQLAADLHAYMPFRPKERKINCNEWPFYE